jgi:hypothetical protein
MTALQTARIVQPRRVVVIRCSAWFASGVGLFFQVTLKLSQNSKVRSPNKGDEQIRGTLMKSMNLDPLTPSFELP